jgi:hypothetical protein
MEDILKELEQLSQQGVDTYSLVDRQRVIQLKLEFGKCRAENKAEKKLLARKLKKMHAEKLAIIRRELDEN